MQKINIKKLLAHKIFRILKWAFLILLALYFILVIFRLVESFKLDRTNAQVEKIHSTKITIDDVMGKNIPPDPGEESDKTIEGVDANKNGIRDDVELAIFEKYPDSAKTRAALLQYALVLQMELTQPFVNEVIATEVVREDNRSHSCLANNLVPRKTPESFRSNIEMKKIDEYISFVEDLQFNTEERIESRNSLLKKLRSYSNLEKDECDIDYSQLDN